MLPDYLEIKFIFRKFLIEVVTALLFGHGLSMSGIKLRLMWKRIQKAVDEDIVLIAGGPSFTDEIARSLLKNRNKFKVCVVNFYNLNKLSEELIPDYYVLSDPAHLKTNNESIAKKNKLLFSYIDRHKIKVISPAGRKWKQIVNPWLSFDDKELLFSSNITPVRPRGYPSNTFFKAIAVAQALKHRKIYLVGLDYNYPKKLFLDENNKLYLRDEHHYGHVDTDLSKDFKSVAHALNWWSLDYHHFRKISSENIFNVTNSSMIDFFERISPEQFIKDLDENI